ncbi:hypothetical protein NA56DRAFT_330548 [Hyaloscypha hepaticicola]|uniref:Uncharacterized protein n=1 Tax=Hyaloscypha hepaticicola TaxID=2082293 RepID=A0A2J6PNC7_9HELO|nr:hypothetical protein NA56DRAFT_330548 [Hyaloscypha hepaticicola]
MNSQQTRLTSHPHRFTHSQSSQTPHPSRSWTPRSIPSPNQAVLAAQLILVKLHSHQNPPLPSSEPWRELSETVEQAQNAQKLLSQAVGSQEEVNLLRKESEW